MASSDKSIEGDVFAILSPEEEAWRDRQEFLETQGYMLRPRFRADWTPSWRGKPLGAVFHAEDGWRLPFRPGVIDATRISDGRLVYLKRVRSDSHELQIHSYLTSIKMRCDPRNHCVPLLDVVQDPLDADESIIVMPFLRYIDSPPFETVDDVLEFLYTILEGLVFIHYEGVAHRHCTYKNIMMDASALFPKSFHPLVQTALPDGMTPAPVLSRAAAPVQYYFTDFGDSARFTSGGPRLVVGSDGLDEGPPELSKTVPYDPFKLDIFLIGNLIRRKFHERYSNLSMLEPLMNQMVHLDPTQRPTAAEAFRQLKYIRQRVSNLYKYWYLQPRESSKVANAFRSANSLGYSLYRTIF
ncbi:kinase-like domain-containing protein [Trametes punicea]|nr:kinase-like domain-containing protein [Trametes punicea]